MAQPDFARIKSNVAKMIDQGAPESDIDAYVAAEGTTPEALRGAGKGNTSYVGAVQQGVSDVVSGVGKTIKDYVAPDAGSTVEAKGQKLAPANYNSATEDFMNRGGAWYDKNWSSLPRAVVENAPALATDVLAGLAARKLGGNVAGALGAGASYLLRTRGEAAESRARNRTGDENAVPNTEDKVVAGAAGIPEAALGALGANRFINPSKVTGTGVAGAVNAGKKLATTAAIEGGVGAGQDVIGQVADTAGTPGGLRVDPGQTFGAGALSAATGTGMAATGAAADLNNARRFRNFDTEAAQRVANRIQDNTDGNLDNTKQARRAVGAAEVDIKSDLTNAFNADPEAKARIDGDDGARRALARLNSGEQVTDGDIANISRAASGTRAGDTVSALASELTAIRTLQKMGDYSGDNFKGGLSTKFEKGARAIYNPVGAATGAGLAALGLTQPAMAMGVMTSAPAAVGGAFGAYLAARALDKATGYRSPAKTFVEKFGGTDSRTPAIAQPPQPQRPGPTGPSISQANTFNGKPIEAPFGSTPVATPADLAKRDYRLSKAVDTALNREVTAQNRDTSREDASFDRSGRMLDSGVRGLAASSIKLQRAQEAAQAAQARREQIGDAKDLVAARKANERMQIVDAQGVAQSRRANDAQAARGDVVQMRDARELMAARRAVEKMQKAAAAANAEAPAPDPIAAAKKLVNGLNAAQRIKTRADREQDAGDRAQARDAAGLMASRQSPNGLDRQQMTDAREMMAARRANAKLNGEGEAPEAAPKPMPKASPTEAPKKSNANPLHMFDEAPWAYADDNKTAAKMILQSEKANGRDITNEAGYLKSTEQRLNAQEAIIHDIAKDATTRDQKEKLQTAMARIKSARSQTQAKEYRDAMKQAMPELADSIDRHFSDQRISTIWKKGT